MSERCSAASCLDNPSEIPKAVEVARLRTDLGSSSIAAVDPSFMDIASKVWNGQDSGTREGSRAQVGNRLLAADRRGGASPHQERAEISGGPAWCGPGSLAALLAFLATAMLALIVVRLWLRLEKGALAILQLVRPCARLRRYIPGQRPH